MFYLLFGVVESKEGVWIRCHVPSFSAGKVSLNISLIRVTWDTKYSNLSGADIKETKLV